MSGARPLTGVRVLDFTENLPGPYVTAIMQRMGAEVIKVERPGGDPARQFPALFERLSAGKQSIVLDLKEDAGRQAAQRLAGTADVVVEGFRPGVMRSFGLGAEELRQANPRLVYCSLSAFGQHGEAAPWPGHDLNAQAATGISRLHVHTPHKSALPIADFSTANAAVVAILAALIERGRSGEGVEVDLALVDTLGAWVQLWSEGLRPPASNGWQGWLLRKIRDQGLAAIPHYAIFRTLDGRWLAVGIVQEAAFWRELCHVLGLGPLARLPFAARLGLAPGVRALLRLAFLRRTQRAWLERFDRRRIPVTPVASAREARQLHAMRRDHAPAWLFAREEPAERTPKLGEHTERVLADLDRM